MKDFDIVIVGAGASGLVAGISAARRKSSVCILEKLSLPGKKITATGNGKCNILSDNVTFDDNTVSSQDPDSARKIFTSIDYRELISFFENMGIYITTKNNYMYPMSLQASTVRETLEREALSQGCRIICDCEVTDISRTDEGFIINNTYSCRKLIISTGGCSSPKLGSDGSGFKLLNTLKIGHTDLYPSLVGLTLDWKYLKTVEGVRHYATVELLCDGRTLSSEYGEFIFNKTGMSGIPVMNCSGTAAESIAHRHKTQLKVSLFDKARADVIFANIKNHHTCKTTTVEQALTGIANSKLIYALLLCNRINPSMTFSSPGAEDCIRKVLDELTGMIFEITGTAGYDNSQVTRGGVRLYDIDITTMESVKVKGLYITGEALDVDCRCGGNNLTFAFITGITAGISASGGTIGASIYDKAKR